MNNTINNNLIGATDNNNLIGTTDSRVIDTNTWVDNDISDKYKTPKYRVGEIVTFSYSAYSHPTFYMGKIIGAEFSDSCFWMYLITKGDSCPLSVPEEHIEEVIYINYQEVTNPPSGT
jgi:hypothetical protein